MKVKAEKYDTSSLNFWYQRKYCKNAQFTELLFLQNIFLIAIISTKMQFLFTGVDTGRGNAKTALLIPTQSDIPVCQIPALISECLPPALPLWWPFPLLTLLMKNNLLWQYSAKISRAFWHLGYVWTVKELHSLNLLIFFSHAPDSILGRNPETHHNLILLLFLLWKEPRCMCWKGASTDAHGARISWHTTAFTGLAVQPWSQIWRWWVLQKPRRHQHLSQHYWSWGVGRSWTDWMKSIAAI